MAKFATKYKGWMLATETAMEKYEREKKGIDENQAYDDQPDWWDEIEDYEPIHRNPKKGNKEWE